MPAVGIVVGLGAALLAALVASLIAYQAGRARERDRSPSVAALFDGVADPDAVDGERRMLAMLGESVIITDVHGNVIVSNTAAAEHGLVFDGRLTDDGVRGLIASAVEGHEPVHADIELDGGPQARHIAVTAQPISACRVAVVCADTGYRRNVDRMRRDFVTNVSHELKTPVGAIMLLSETIADAGDDVEMIRHFAGRIGMEAQRLDGLVRRLIELGRMSNPGERPKQTVDARDLVHGAIADTEVTAAARHTDVRMRDGAVDRPLAVCVDATAVHIALKNLVENAINYSPEHSDVTVDVTQADGHVRIRVIDHGVGIPSPLQGRIFERFYRVDPARSRLTGGTGLGLSIANHHIRANGGTIEVWSKPGEGSTFTVALPLAGTAGIMDKEHER
ncbi:sensor histidine kinase [Bifidobacterium pseudolongum]|uniref:Sensor-like histidine kinase SenX3 n=2 Tax=Bifidobacterium pseudolongum TaxID=1694 RepID=A0A4Q5BF32_9BIFI|nr:ATP-binding protein [Bifidobacterium pseudolongum]RYQ01532.1 signal transduction histidine kinase [Bifidobacterium pseudolongum subsp. globosum]RYQ27377.1 signal transduction histidine kinase [Bifidobacterium pseudolongum subsp. globosum]RYQ27816.1 signal transduction histidine kinase [Bifidobacterium pseudolongum subsp. globosum]RYQ43221.1 signal transduction histidine kinase [Bifidobacterium pseudolongum subsp. globosum]RYQ70353.1 signal transduction histidine kinase [Bifidobacterium pseu